MSIEIGTIIGHYEIVGWLGAGGMGVVYRARDPRLGRDVAIKLIPETFAVDGNRLQRFEQEARAAGKLNHPNILSVYDIGVHAGAPYIVSELLEGESLRSRLHSGPLPSRKAIEYARQIAEGLAAAHERNIVHRDVKPDNLFITKDGRIKILDFGIAKLTRPGDDAQHTGLLTETEAGMVVGTAGYMSPEQVRGEAVDPRSDIFSFGTVFYEMLTGRPAFTRETAPETMTAVLKEDPPALRAPDVSASLARIVARCLEKTREMRFQSARDLAFGLEMLSDTAATAMPAAAATPRRWRLVAGAAVVVLSLLTAVASWRIATAAPSIENVLVDAKFTPFTNFEGSELDAAISPDGRFVSFVGDRDGPFHVWLKQVGTGAFVDLTPGMGDQRNAGPNRSVGFSANGSEVWINGTAGRRMFLLPLTGGTPRTFLSEHAVNAAWSHDGSQLVYFTYDEGDPLFVADRTGGNARQILISKKGDHNHFPAWSPDGQWIYYAHSIQAIAEFDVWRIPSSGGTPERLTDMRNSVRYVTPIDARTVLFVAPGPDRAGPWLWALDVTRKVTHRVSIGLERYLSVAASNDGRRLVATVSERTASLWSVPILDRLAEERDAALYPTATVRASAPRFGRDSLFYLSSSGPGDGLWRLQDGKAVEIWKGSDEALYDSPSVSPLGDRVAVVLGKQGKQQLTLISADGADHQSFADGIDVRGTSAWSPDAKWIVTGGSDAQGDGLFKIPLAGGAPVRLVTGTALDPVWSPDDTLIVYSGQPDANAPLLAVRPDGTPATLPAIRVPSGGNGRARFLPGGKGLVYMKGTSSDGAQDFWLLDLATNKSRQLTKLSNAATMSTFDIAPGGRQIVFDRVRENSDVRLIDLPK